MFALGGAPYLGSMARHRLAKPVSGIAMKPGDAGYWLTARDGGVFAFGNGGFYGNAVSTSCVAPPTSGSVIVQYATAIVNGQAETRLGRWPRPLLLGRRARYQPWSIQGHLRRLHGLHSALPGQRHDRSRLLRLRALGLHAGLRSRCTRRRQHQPRTVAHE